jgi:CubicO group peptidase (beta-lactamase class C family)
MTTGRLDRLREVIEQDVADRKYWGARIRVAQHGEVVADLTIGHADAEARIPLQDDTVFSIFSVSKAFVNILVLRAIELGRFAFTTKVSELIPEFAGPPRDRATVYHLLTHTSGLPGVWEVRPGLPLDDLSELLEAVVASVHGASEPGARCDYSPMANHVLLGEILRRTDPGGRTINEIFEQDLFEPLGLQDTRYGLREHMRERHVVPDFRGVVPVQHRTRQHPDENGIFLVERQEAVWMGAASTANDLGRLTEMLRLGGTLDGARILSPAMLRLARQNHTGDLPNELYKAAALRNGYEVPPAYIGLGFSVRGTRIVKHQFGTLTSPETFGNYGAGSTEFWIDPELDATFVGLTTGLLPQGPNIDRFQRLSDIVVGALS